MPGVILLRVSPPQKGIKKQAKIRAMHIFWHFLPAKLQIFRTFSGALLQIFGTFPARRMQIFGYAAQLFYHCLNTV